MSVKVLTHPAHLEVEGSFWGNWTLEAAVPIQEPGQLGQTGSGVHADCQVVGDVGHRSSKALGVLRSSGELDDWDLHP